jgi:acyl carrier protein
VLAEREQAEKGAKQMPTQATTEGVEQVIFDGLAELGAERDQITRDATFDDLDVDSLDLVELAQIVEDEFGVELEGEDMKDLRTVGDAIDLVVTKSS